MWEMNVGISKTSIKKNGQHNGSYRPKSNQYYIQAFRQWSQGGIGVGVTLSMNCRGHFYIPTTEVLFTGKMLIFE